MLNWYRQIIRLRRTNEALAQGAHVPVNVANTNILAYLRRKGADSVLVLLNMAGSAQQVKLEPELAKRSAMVLAARGSDKLNLQAIQLDPFGVVVAQLK